MEHKDPQYKPPEEQFKSLFEKPVEKKWEHIHCPNCNNEVHAGDINLDRAVAKCGSCHAVFSIDTNITSLQQQPEDLAALIENMEVVHFQNGLDIKLKPLLAESYGVLSWMYGFLSAILLLVFIGAMIASSLSFVPSLITGMLFLVLSIPFPYFLAKYKNTLNFYIDKYHFDFEQDPFRLPFMRKSLHLNTRDIEKVYTKKYKRWDSQREVYELRLVELNVTDRLIMRDFKDPNQVRLLVNEINQYLAKVKKEI